MQTRDSYILINLPIFPFSFTNHNFLLVIVAVLKQKYNTWVTDYSVTLSWVLSPIMYK